METTKEVLNFFNAAMFYDYKKLNITDKLNQACRCIINNYYETITVERMLITFSLIDDVILKNIKNDIRNIIENITDLRSNILYMLSFEKTVKEDKSKNNRLIGCMSIHDTEILGKRYCFLREAKDIMHNVKLSDNAIAE